MERPDTLKRQLKHVRETAASQVEREAVVDLLVMTMYADHFIDAAENDAIDRVADQINSDASLPLSQYVNASIANVRRVLDDRDGQEALLQDIGTRLGTDRMRRIAYQASRAVATADEEMANEEEEFLSSVRAAFEIRPQE